MKSIMIASWVWLIGLACLAADDAAFRLELESPVRTLRLGQTAQLKLTIIGSGVYSITEGTEGINADNMKAGSFVYQFEFKPQRTGQFAFGPYTLAVNGQKLTSNSVAVEVLPQWDGKLGTYFRVNTNVIILGEDVELTVESWANKYNHQSMYLDRKDTFTSRSGGSGSFSGKFGKDGEAFYSKMSWLICPKKAGEFKIDRSLFREFPPDVTPPAIAITVKEPAQPSAAPLPPAPRTGASEGAH